MCDTDDYHKIEAFRKNIQNKEIAIPGDGAVKVFVISDKGKVTKLE